MVGRLRLREKRDWSMHQDTAFFYCENVLYTEIHLPHHHYSPKAAPGEGERGFRGVVVVGKMAVAEGVSRRT